VEHTVRNHSSDHYRRSARSLRGRLDGKPGELYRSLRDLSDRYDSNYPVSSGRTGVTRVVPDNDFTSRIVAKIHDGVLLYSDRLQLLSDAADYGIGRFEANLIIAAVQHRYGTRLFPEQVIIKPNTKTKVPATDLIMAVVLIQILILILAWTIFLH
jgi:hypothetical protein